MGEAARRRLVAQERSTPGAHESITSHPGGATQDETRTKNTSRHGGRAESRGLRAAFGPDADAPRCTAAGPVIRPLTSSRLKGRAKDGAAHYLRRGAAEVEALDR